MADPGANDMVAIHFRRSCETLELAANDVSLRTAIHQISDTITNAFRAGNKLLIAGNGGSAADAQHIAGEFLSRLNFDRNPLPAIALTTDTSVLTAIGNDYGFEKAFERQVRGLGRAGDVFIAISTSGTSPTYRRLKAARDLGMITIGFMATESLMTAMRPLSCCSVAGDPLIQQIRCCGARLWNGRARSVGA